jgi:hypothetical protein
MIVYYDIIADKEIASDSYESSTPAPGVRAIQSKKITISDDVGIASNAGEDDDEGATAEALDDAAQTVINVVYSAKLTQVNLDKKEYKTLQKAYWKKLIDSLNELKWQSLGFDTDNAPPTEKTAAAKAESDAAGKLSAYERRSYDELVAKVKSYKANFEGLQKFVADEVLPNFDECEFYTCEDGELGQCMIIPARYVGESPAPIFYLFVDGLREKKE